MSDELLEELRKQTQPVEDLPKVEVKPEEPAPKPELNPEDFGSESETVTDPPPGGEPGEPKKPVNFKKIASGFVKFFNSLLKIGAKRLYPEVILKPEDPAILVDLKTRTEMIPDRDKEAFLASELESKDTLRYAWNRLSRVEELIAAAPLTEDEKEMLIDPLADVIEKYRWMQVGPEANLLLAVIVVMAPRIEPLFPGLMSSLESKVSREAA
jgi:hypothetical protein